MKQTAFLLLTLVGLLPSAALIHRPQWLGWTLIGSSFFLGLFGALLIEAIETRRRFTITMEQNGRIRRIGSKPSPRTA